MQIAPDSFKFFFPVNSSQISGDTFLLTEITLNLKNLHNLQHSQVDSSNGDDDTCAPEINQQPRTKPKFFIFCRWVLSHFAHDKHTNASICLESIQQTQLQQKC